MILICFSDIMKEIFVYITSEGNMFYITDRELELAGTLYMTCDELDELVGWYDDAAKLKEQLKLMFSAYRFHTSDSYTELVPLSAFKEFKNPVEDMVKYLKEQCLIG